ncbi:ABC transporter substrate-binding protein [Cellulomonas sp. NTE-D12]|uniref:ABC transporter substrate-binding protein n=1 Tax=Cellulomonas sp. NTE-D12 TaxID=2962632 RepID=UPI0030811FFD|nr:sulfonate ABC transporter substrate-binding protein [Cellulomonas sp. NTE-D12]
MSRTTVPTGRAMQRRSSRPRLRRLLTGAAVTVVAATLAACSPAVGAATPAQTGPVGELRLGYFANVTHAPALVGVGRGLFAARLKAAGTPTLTTQVFNAGPAAIEALNAGAVDAAFVGPNPAINGFIQSGGDALRIVAGSTSGGAQLVVRTGITSAHDLVGTDLATPQLGGTQDVALRSWLHDQGLRSPLSGGGDVTITPTDNAQTFQLFTDHRIDGAWLPEPWASRLVLEGGAHVLVDEKDLWPGGSFVTTHLIVSRRYLAAHPDTVRALLQGLQDSVDWLHANPGSAASAVNAQLVATGGKPLSDKVLARAFAETAFSTDPLAATLKTSLAHAVAAGTAHPASIDGIYDLRLLNELRRQSGTAPVSAAGLGKD